MPNMKYDVTITFEVKATSPDAASNAVRDAIYNLPFDYVLVDVTEVEDEKSTTSWWWYGEGEV